jgi:hypothetical protein
MGELHDLADWRARRRAREDVSMGAPPFVLEEPCPGCGARRVATMVWRRLEDASAGGAAAAIPFPRMDPHFVCRDGAVVHQEITDAGVALVGWSGILGHFEPERESG